jgi:hypothetical protein
MDRPRLIPQIYGYTVCLVGVITMLIASGGLIDGIFDSGRPEMSREVDPSLRTFDTYKQSRIERARVYEPSRPPPPARAVEGVTAVEPLPPDSVLRVTYQEERKSQIDRARYQGNKRVVTSLFVLVLAIALFLTHWRWLRGLARAETTAA